NIQGKTMIYHIGRWIQSQADAFGFLRLLNYLSFRSIMAALTAVLIVFLLSPRFIRAMHRRNFLDRVRETGIDSAFDKAGTPTLGGVLLIVAMTVSILLWCNLANPFLLLSLAALLWFGGIGFWDDWLKSSRGSGDKGLGEITKLVLQGLFALAFIAVYVGPFSPVEPGTATQLYVPFLKRPLLDLGIFYGFFIFLFMLLVANAVNITDGLDGLAITPSIFVAGVLAVFAYVMGNTIYAGYLQYPYLRGVGELTVFVSAFIGAGLGFLWYNAYPAQIFMGDTGSLAIGGMLAVLSVLLKQELLFPLLGGLFLVEALTSQVQDKIGVRWLGRRIFYRAPLHHSLQHRGFAETKVVIRLWIVAGLLALLSLATLKIR
ncbi:MAG: phospho-N-acetylmuramoyl-pentapeptide-transferase, partial [Deltaproteobacteria bacterium]|nr:phospho-N-acetylmuramoyl-pentapeptide-transferase [Deltaproteobacteria bacterium]